MASSLWFRAVLKCLHYSLSLLHTHTLMVMGPIPIDLHHLFTGPHSIMNVLEIIPRLKLAASRVAGSIPSPAVCLVFHCWSRAQKCTKIHFRSALTFLIKEQDVAERVLLMHCGLFRLTAIITIRLAEPGPVYRAEVLNHPWLSLEDMG